MRAEVIESLAKTQVASAGLAAAESDIWRVLAEAGALSDYCQAWILLLCRSYAGLEQAVLLLGPADKGPFAIEALWPAATAAKALAETGNSVFKMAVEKRKPAVEGLGDGTGQVHVGYPLVFSGLLHGAVVVEGKFPDAVIVRRLLRHLQWSAAGIEAFLARDSHRGAGAAADKAQFIVHAVDALANATRGRDAARTLADILARRFKCDSVAIGRRPKFRSRLVAISQTAGFDRRAALARQIEAAQDEAIDQQTMLLAPHAPASTPFVAAGHEALSKLLHGVQVLSVPLVAGSKAVGAITLRRAAPFEQSEIDLIDAMATAAGPMIEQKYLADISVPGLAWMRVNTLCGKIFGPRHLGLKAGLAGAIAATAFLALAQDEYRIRAKAQIQGEVRRLVAAPFDGYIRSQSARAGDVVEESTILAELQDNDLVLERLRQVAKQKQFQLELDKGLAKRDLAETNIAQAQIDQAQADIDLSDQMIARAKLRAPFASVVVSGDLSQSVGRPVQRGDTLFELAPLDRYRVTALVPEADIRLIRVGQRGELLLSALPDQSYKIEIVSITPVAQAADGVNGYEVIGFLAGKDERVRPGMEGVVKIDAGTRNLAWIWAHPMLDWLRVKAWGLIP